MSDYDAKQVSRWLGKIVEKLLIPAPRASKTRADQKRESLEKQRDKYDVTKQDDEFEEDKETGLFSLPRTVSGVSVLLNPYLNFKSCSPMTFTPVGHLAGHEEHQRKIQAFAGSIAAVGEARPETPESRQPAKPMPDYIQCLTGWRAWQVGKERLQALGTFSIWHPKIAVPAVCAPSLSFPRSDDGAKDHVAPHKDCTCGYWSFKSQELLTGALESYIGSVVVIGTVSIWGKVIECENGFRSEYAYPKELWLLKPGLEYLSWKYGVPIRRL